MNNRPRMETTLARWREGQRDLAVGALETLRSRRAYDFQLNLRHLGEGIRGAETTLEELGTSKAEVEELTRFYHLQAAKRELRELNDWKWTSPSFLEWNRHNRLAATIKQHAEHANGSLEALDTTEEALDELVRRNHRRDAEALLPLLREKKTQEEEGITTLLMEFECHLRAGQLTPTDVGCSDQEFRDFEWPRSFTIG